MFKGAFIHHIAIDPKLSIYIIEVVYGLLVWIHECPIATYKGDGFGWLYMEFRRYIKEYITSIHQRPFSACGLYCAGSIAGEGAYFFKDETHKLICFLR